ncbi:hypothetical protein T484DRAFT_1956099 [Baffinella frigidus]|nr:hypothetical protein T484DRAFT_1956099 [Cryptophyta sp. CCMP2293]
MRRPPQDRPSSLGSGGRCRAPRWARSCSSSTNRVDGYSLSRARTRSRVRSPTDLRSLVLTGHMGTHTSAKP